MRLLKVGLVVFLLSGSLSAQFGVDVRDYGAVCNGTDVRVAVQAAFDAGEQGIFLPKDCLWIPPKGIIPVGTTVWCEDRLRSVIQSAAVPSTRALIGMPGVTLFNCNNRSNTCTHADCPIFLWQNATHNRVAFVASTGNAVLAYAVDGEGVDEYSGTNQRNYGTGETAFASNHGMGNAVRYDNESDHGSAVSIFRWKKGGGLLLGSIDQATAGNAVTIWQNVEGDVTGDMIVLNQQVSNYSGRGIALDMAQGSGQYTGQFLEGNINNQNVWRIRNSGALEMQCVNYDQLDWSDKPVVQACCNCGKSLLGYCTSTGDGALAFFINGVWKC